MTAKKKEVIGTNVPVVPTSEVAMIRLQALREAIGEATSEDHEVIAAWEKMIKGHALRQDWMLHPITNEVFASLAEKVREINLQLSTEEDMNESTRRAIFKQKQAYLWLITLFADAADDTVLETLITEIESRTEEFTGY